VDQLTCRNGTAMDLVTPACIVVESVNGTTNVKHRIPVWFSIVQSLQSCNVFDISLNQAGQLWENITNSCTRCEVQCTDHSRSSLFILQFKRYSAHVHLHHHHQKSTPMVPTLIQIKPVYIPTIYISILWRFY